MAADEDKGVVDLGKIAQEFYRYGFACADPFASCRHGEDAVRLHQRHHRTGAAADRSCHQMVGHPSEFDPDKVQNAHFRGERPGEGGLRGLWFRLFLAEHGCDQTADKDPHGENSGNRISRQADDGLVVDNCKDDRFAGLDVDAMDNNLAQFVQDLGGVVTGPGRGAGVRDHDVIFSRRFFDRLFYALIGISDKRPSGRRSAPFMEISGQDPAVEFNDVAGLDRLAGLDKFTAGRDDNDLRHSPDLDRVDVGCKHGADVDRADGVAFRQDEFCCDDVLANGSDMLPGRDSADDFNRFFVYLMDILDHDNGIITFRDGIAGIDRKVLL